MTKLFVAFRWASAAAVIGAVLTFFTPHPPGFIVYHNCLQWALLAWLFWLCGQAIIGVDIPNKPPVECVTLDG